MVQGVVDKVDAFPIAKLGGKLAYKIVIGGVKYGQGFDKPACYAGDEVAFDCQGDVYNTIVKGSLRIVTKGTGVPTPATTTTTTTSPAATKRNFGGFPIGPTDGQRSIVRQNSLARATELFVARAPVHKTPKLASDAEHIIDIARIFEAYSTGSADKQEAEKMLATVANDMEDD